MTTTLSSATAIGTEECAVRDVLARTCSAWAANDASAFVADYVADATVVLPGSFKEGREAVRAYMTGVFAGPMKGSRGMDTPRSIRFPGPDAAVVVSEAGILMAGESQIPADRQRRATWTLVRRDGRWLIAAYHNCPAN